MKLLLKVFGALVLIVIVVIVFGLFSINSIVEESVARFGPEVTGTPVVLEESALTPWTGAGSLKGLSIGNPESFGSENAFSLGEIAVDVELSSLSEEVILINSIAIIDPEVLYLNNGETDNLRALLANITDRVGGGEAQAETEAEESGTAKKIIIDEFIFSGANISASHALLGDQRLSIDLPDLQLTGIGRESGGATLKQAGEQIFAYLNTAIRSEVSGSAIYEQALSQVQDRIQEEIRQVEEQARQLEAEALQELDSIQSQAEEVEGQVRGLLDAFGR